MSQVVGEVLNLNPLAVLSGPSFAIEVGQNLPTAVTIASLAEEICSGNNSTFEEYDCLVGPVVAE